MKDFGYLVSGWELGANPVFYFESTRAYSEFFRRFQQAQNDPELTSIRIEMAEPDCVVAVANFRDSTDEPYELCLEKVEVKG